MSNTKRESKALLTRREAAEYLGCCVHTLMAWGRAGKVREIRLSRRAVRYRVADLERFIDEGANK
ncbi:MAG: helix-turn-helix transcriptional regulator [Puniceicoccales bacterium]